MRRAARCDLGIRALREVEAPGRSSSAWTRSTRRTPRRAPFYAPGRVEDDGLGPTDGRLVELDFSDDDIDRVREAYVKHVEAVDDEPEAAGRGAGRHGVFVLGDHGLALGEHGYRARGADLAPDLRTRSRT